MFEKYIYLEITYTTFGAFRQKIHAYDVKDKLE